ncbi:hypothetical protein QYH69_33945 [Paraburkholderia sp. SARCC-3016]|uniref:hypothetical protein n=1 Tax=Paraburkholderia sp. SARCC-3016 TaxID=3058611 RepID=UPI002807CE64|nr:hypothetical protein [Paraburkholderia sp. SARCC-3016]MDQ7982228.1 hypothetical protein [Paraburkholderia sp. SARCC-3016]
MRVDASTAVSEGDSVIAGRDNVEFQVIKTHDNNNVSAVQGTRPYATTSFIAAIKACAGVSFQRKTAVIMTSTSLGAVYRACGASVQVNADFTIDQFACYVGNVPSIPIAQVLQEEGGVVCWTGQQLKFLRLDDLMKQTSVKRVDEDRTVDLQSSFLQRHEIPFFYSTDDSGNFAYGNRTKTRAAFYMPRQDARTLANMTKVLIMRKQLKSPYAPAINAGQVITVVDTPFAIVTAAHVYQTGSDGSGANAYSKFWLGGLQ